MKYIRGRLVSNRTYRLLEKDIREYGRAFMQKDWLGFGRRVPPSDIFILQPVNDPLALDMARKEGLIVDG